MTFYQDSAVVIYHADCRDILPQLSGVDAVITDPPYELGFMGKDWDKKGISFQSEIWKLILNACKPGAHLLAFGGTRTFHRLAMAIEDAGWEIRDTVMWVYGQGFPKSLDVSKAIDKMAGAKREVLGVRQYPTQPHGRSNIGQGYRIGETEGTEIGNVITVPATSEAKQWEGWGTALKPAWEPIILARKPLDGTVAQNVLKYGTGAINIDRCRISTDRLAERQFDMEAASGKTQSINPNSFGFIGIRKDEWLKQGRFPANLIHDGSEEVLAEFAKAGVSKSTGGTDKISLESPVNTGGGNPYFNFGDAGSTARFFYCAKASRAERGEGNKHPTVKPLALMRYLIKLITPPNGIILDPFMGSGSTLVAARQLGFKAIGIDTELNYCEIAKKRCEMGMVLEIC